MLSVQSFITGMELLKKCYIGWQFDTKDEMQVKVWYTSFKNLTEEQFQSVIKEYYTHNRQPPKSVRDLTDILVDKFYATAKVPPEKALALVKDIVTDCGGWDYGGKAEIYKRLKSYPASLTETVREFEDSIRNMPANDPFTANRFREAYAIRLRASAIREVDKRLGLAPQAITSPTLGGCLPYET